MPLSHYTYRREFKRNDFPEERSSLCPLNIFSTAPMRVYPVPLWSGEKLASGRLLIWGEQGVGDEVMFAGLIPDVIGLGERCILDCDARLKPLFARFLPSVGVFSLQELRNNPPQHIAAHLPDWHWLEAREDTPWYPTLPFFRQPVPAIGGTWCKLARAFYRAVLESSWWARKDLNLEPTDYESAALTVELRALLRNYK